MKITRSATVLCLCLSAAIAAMGAASANEPVKDEGKSRPKADSSQPVDDSWITTKVKADLLATENVPGSDIEVKTVNGTVTLKGMVTSKAQKDKAVDVARNIKGVSNVDASGLMVGTR